MHYLMFPVQDEVVQWSENQTHITEVPCSNPSPVDYFDSLYSEALSVIMDVSEMKQKENQGAAQSLVAQCVKRLSV